MTYRTKIDVSKLFEQVRYKRGVVGYFRYVRKKYVMGREVPSWSVWFFVEHKAKTQEEIEDLRLSDDLIPEMIDGVPTDVHEVSEFLDDSNLVLSGEVYFINRPGREALVAPLSMIFVGLFAMIAFSFHLVGVPLVFCGLWFLVDHNRAVELYRQLSKINTGILK